MFIDSYNSNPIDAISGHIRDVCVAIVDYINDNINVSMRAVYCGCFDKHYFDVDQIIILSKSGMFKQPIFGIFKAGCFTIAHDGRICFVSYGSYGRNIVMYSRSVDVIDPGLFDVIDEWMITLL